MARAKLTSKGQITIPKRVREHLKLQPGNEVIFSINRRGNVVLRAMRNDITSMRGILKDVVPKREHPVTIEEMNEAILREHSKK